MTTAKGDKIVSIGTSDQMNLGERKASRRYSEDDRNSSDDDDDYEEDYNNDGSEA